MPLLPLVHWMTLEAYVMVEAETPVGKTEPPLTACWKSPKSSIISVCAFWLIRSIVAWTSTPDVCSVMVTAVMSLSYTDRAVARLVVSVETTKALSDPPVANEKMVR